MTWDKGRRRWEARYYDATDKRRSICYFDTQEQAAHAVNAAILTLPPDVQRRRKTNPVVDGQLVPRALTAPGHGPKALRKRRREESGAASPPSTRARRPRRAVNFDDYLQPDDDDGWD